MATDTKQQTPEVKQASATPASNKDKALAHIETLIVEVTKHAGKPGLNPFLYINDVLRPHSEALKTGKLVSWVNDDEGNPQKNVKVLDAKGIEELAVEVLKFTADESNFTFKPKGINDNLNAGLVTPANSDNAYGSGVNPNTANLKKPIVGGQ